MNEKRIPFKYARRTMHERRDGNGALFDRLWARIENKPEKAKLDMLIRFYAQRGRYFALTEKSF